jgi:hypothetical protein
MRRVCLLASIAGLGVAALAGPAASSVMHRTAAAKTCLNNDILANLSWGQKCLGAGEFCKVGNPEYHAYGFDCPASGHLTDYAGSAASPTTTTSTPTTPGLPPTPATVHVRCPANAPLSVKIATSHPAPSAATGKQALSMYESDPGTTDQASPYQCVLRWAAKWTGQAWWLVGEFVSPWGVHFVADASIAYGQVNPDLGGGVTYGGLGPSQNWVKAWAHAWGMTTLYTRLTPTDAIDLVQQGAILPVGSTVLGVAAKLTADSPPAGWDFAFYLHEADGTDQVVVVAGLTGGPAVEDTYGAGYGYGFGHEAQPETSIPLSLNNWVRSVVSARGWKPANI